MGKTEQVSCAVYARKSTAQKGKADTAKSVPQQIEAAREFIATKGWTLNAAHIYSDDEISGAEFDNRPGFQRLKAAALRPKPPFQKLIVRELSRLGREASETGWVIKQFSVSGIEIFDVTGKSLTPKNWQEKALSGIQQAADEAHREASSTAVHGAFTRMHKAGKVVGGRVFGYKNRVVYDGLDRDGNPKRSHVVREIDPAEAAVVKTIYQKYETGWGLKKIARYLNAIKAPSVKHYRRADGLAEMDGWSPMTVRSVLSRETYRGVVIWNKTRKKNDWGQWAPTSRPESEWLSVSVPELQIIKSDLWKRVAARRAEVETRQARSANGRLWGRPPKHGSVNLLAGLAKCGVCGGGLVVESGGNKRGRQPEYVCHRRRTSGSCRNTVRMRVADLDQAILLALEQHMLVPDIIQDIYQLAEQDEMATQRNTLEREAKQVARTIAQFVRMVETHRDVESLVGRLRELEARQRAIRLELADLRPLPRVSMAVVENRMAEFRRLLHGSKSQARVAVQKLLAGRITFTPQGRGYQFTAETRFAKLLSGMTDGGPRNGPQGIGVEAPDFQLPFDAEYGALIDRVLRVSRSAPGGT